jgi:hypothetical protein
MVELSCIAAGGGVDRHDSIGLAFLLFYGRGYRVSAKADGYFSWSWAAPGHQQYFESDRQTEGTIYNLDYPQGKTGDIGGQTARLKMGTGRRL